MLTPEQVVSSGTSHEFMRKKEEKVLVPELTHMACLVGCSYFGLPGSILGAWFVYNAVPIMFSYVLFLLCMTLHLTRFFLKPLTSYKIILQHMV
jgi:hypothetical protein